MGPLHEKDVAPVAVPVSDIVLPLHSAEGDAVAVTEVGTVRIMIEGVVAVVLPQLLVAVSVYTPAESVVVTMPAGLRLVDENPSGPDHK